jgi:hypothetical protein
VFPFVCDEADSSIFVFGKQPDRHGFINQGIPVILPRQVASKGHTSFFVELCRVGFGTDGLRRIEHVAGARVPIDTLTHMRTCRELPNLGQEGSFIAVQFRLHHPPQAMEQLLKSQLDRIEQSQAGQQPIVVPPALRIDDDNERRERGAYSRGPRLVVCASIPLEAIAFFPADPPHSVIERDFRTLTRSERIARILPKIRRQWIEWESSERTRFSPKKPPAEIRKDASADWKRAAAYDRLAHQSTARPIKPAEDLKNLACADCAQFYKRNRSQLPSALPEKLRADLDFNKRISTGSGLISNVDKVFSPLLTPSA